MKIAYPIPTPLAMTIADVSNLKFNEAISRCYYRPLTEGKPGQPRDFDEAEMFGLYVFGELIRLGFNLPMAASRAQGARDVLIEHPEAKSIWISYGPKADSVWFDGVPEGDKPQASIVFDVRAVRSNINRRLKEHLAIVKRRAESLLEKTR